MDFALSPEQEAIRDAVRQYCRDSYGFRSRMALLDTEEGFSRDHWETFAELGWLGAALPEEFGGFGGSAIENAIILEEFGRALVVEPFLSCAVVAGQVIAASGKEASARLLPSLMAGKSILALAHGEKIAFHNHGKIATRAEVTSGGCYKLSGTKFMVLGGPTADQFIVSAKILNGTNLADEHTSLFMVDSAAAGVTRTDYRLIDGSRASDICLNEVSVCQDRIVGDSGCALEACRHALAHAILGICAEAVGIMDSALWITRDFLKGRDQSGAPLHTFQALQHRMADMLVEVELARSALHHGLYSLMQKDAAARAKGISACKVQVSQSAKFVGSNGVQLHGALGLTDDHRIGQYFKRLTVISALFGDISYHLQQFSDGYGVD